MEDTLMTTVSGEGEDVMLPSGFGDGDDFLDPDSWTGDGAGEDTADSSAGDADLTMVNEDGGEEQSAAGEDAADTSDGEEQVAEKPARKLKLKVNHEEEEVDIDQMSDEELIGHIQKSRAFDASREAENKRRYRQVYQEQIDAGMTEALAKMVAAHEVGGTYALTDDKPAAAPAAVGDLAGDVAQLKALYPDFKEVPDEVARAYSQGVPLLTAYLAYRDKQSSKAAGALKKENAVLKQNANSAAKAPIRGVSGGGQAQTKVDPMVAAFDADAW